MNVAYKIALISTKIFFVDSSQALETRWVWSIVC